MSQHHEARLRLYAGFAAAHATLVLVALVVGADGLWITVFITAAPFLLAWGHFNVHVATNDALDETDRTRWRGMLFLLPWSMALYWFLHVRAQ